jgi:hypothetical protein
VTSRRPGRSRWRSPWLPSRSHFGAAFASCAARGSRRGRVGRGDRAGW